MDGAGIHYLNASLSTKWQIRTTSAKFCTRKVGDWLCCSDGSCFTVRVSAVLEQLGRGEFRQLFQPDRLAIPKSDSVIDEIVEAVKELSKTGLSFTNCGNHRAN